MRPSLAPAVLLPCPCHRLPKRGRSDLLRLKATVERYQEDRNVRGRAALRHLTGSGVNLCFVN
jgi:hypothetical protein